MDFFAKLTVDTPYTLPQTCLTFIADHIQDWWEWTTKGLQFSYEPFSKWHKVVPSNKSHCSDCCRGG